MSVYMKLYKKRANTHTTIMVAEPDSSVEEGQDEIIFALLYLYGC